MGDEHDHVSEVVVTQYGKLAYRAPNLYWVTNKLCRRYVPRVGDNVVAVIEERMGEYYKVDIRSGSLALVNRLAFDSATKRNKPDLHRGSVLFCRVIGDFRDCDTELSCASPIATAKDWASGESIYGELPEGLV